MRFVSLFAGIGGFDLGLERAGMECVAQVEIDRNCLGVLGHHWPSVRRYEDVRNVGRRELGSVDLICGGFPCQDVSVAGRRKGLAGERSGLWFEYHRIVASTRPRWVVVENVPGLLSSNKGQDFAVILRGLVECGYGVAWRIFDAQYFGVAQRRRRVFIVGSLGDGCAAKVLFESEGVPGDSAPSRETGQKVAYAIAASVRGTGDGHGQGWNSNYVAASIKADSPSRRNGGSDPISGEFVIANSLGSHHGRNDLDSIGAYLVGPLQAHSKEHGHAMTTQQAVDAGQIIAFDWQAGDGGSDESFRGKSRSYIVRKGEYAGVRRLTPTECERLQGFLDGWTAVNGQSDSVRYRQLGNAVAVPCPEWIGNRIKRIESQC